MDMKRHTKGFTLTELLIAVGIVGILASVAVPSYRESVKRSHRAEAQIAVLGAAQAMERYFTINNTYAGAAFPPVYPTQVPADGPATHASYTLSLTVIGTNNYEILATRSGGQAGDACGDFKLTAAGVRSLVGPSGGKTVPDCWK